MITGKIDKDTPYDPDAKSTESLTESVDIHAEIL